MTGFDAAGRARRIVHETLLDVALTDPDSAKGRAAAGELAARWSDTADRLATTAALHTLDQQVAS